MTVVLDSGALIASENDDRMFASFISATRSRGHSILIPATVLAETWRGASTHPRAARLLAAIDGFPVLDERAARATGSLLAKTQGTIVDADVVTIAIAMCPSTVVTSDIDDITRLLHGVGVSHAAYEPGKVVEVDVLLFKL